MGMVLIPIGLYKTTVDNDIHFNQLEKESKARIRYKKYCSHCGKEVASSDIIKGYEYEKDKYVVMTDDELEKIKAKKDKTIHILQFAKMSEVNMIYYEKDYYAIPDSGAEKAYELLRQSLLAEKKVAIAAVPKQVPFVAYDCLQAGDRVLLDVPLIERKQVLADLIREEERLAVCRYIEEKGSDLFELTKQRELEGVVAKRKDSLYQLGKRTKEWIKFKRMADEDFVICGYQPGDMIKLILGEYENGELKYAGTVTLGVQRDIVEVLHEGRCPFKLPPKGKEQAVFKGIRDDIRGNEPISI